MYGTFLVCMKIYINEDYNVLSTRGEKNWYHFINNGSLANEDTGGYKKNLTGSRESCHQL